MAALLKHWLGIDAEEMSKSFMDATKMFRDFCIHFDGRMVALAGEVRQLRDEIRQLKEASNGKLTGSPTGTAIEFAAGTSDGSDASRTDQRSALPSDEPGNNVESVGDGTIGTRAA